MPVCGTPSADPVPPRVEVTAALVAHSREVSLPVRFTDASVLDHTANMYDLGTSESGVTAMKLTADPFGPGTWQELTTTVRLPDPLPGGLWIRARDAAGNESEPQYMRIQTSPKSRVDQAIAREERAEDLVAAGKLGAAKSQVEASLVPLGRVAILAATRCALPGRQHVLATLAAIGAHKGLAIAALRQSRSGVARTQLDRALDLERALATWADANRVSFEEFLHRGAGEGDG